MWYDNSETESGIQNKRNKTTDEGVYAWKKKSMCILQFVIRHFIAFFQVSYFRDLHGFSKLYTKGKGKHSTIPSKTIYMYSDQVSRISAVKLAI